MTISLGIRKVEKLLQRDRDFSRGIETMEMHLGKNRKKKYLIQLPDPIRPWKIKRAKAGSKMVLPLLSSLHIVVQVSEPKVAYTAIFLKFPET
jgi:hypothetical protein